MPMIKRLGSEFLGTFWLVFGGCGSAVLAAAFPDVGIGLVGVSLAFGLTVLTMAYAVGHISGGHFNLAVTLGLWAGGVSRRQILCRIGLRKFLPPLLPLGSCILSHRAPQGFPWREVSRQTVTASIRPADIR